MRKTLLALFIFMLPLIHVNASEGMISLLSPQSNQTLFAGEEVVCSVKLNNSKSIHKVKIYIDDNCAKEFLPKKELSCSVIGTAEGTHTVRAEALDATGKVLSETSVDFLIALNSAPQISAVELDVSEKPVIDIFEQNSVHVSVSDSDGDYSYTEIALNGENIETHTEDSFDVNLDKVAAGDNNIKITAFDTHGCNSVYEKNFIANRKIGTVIMENDFEKYTGGTPSGFLNFVTKKGGYFNAVKTDDASMGKSMALCVEQHVEQNDVDPNIHYELPDKYIKYSFELSFMMPGNKDGNYDTTATMRCRNSNGSELRILDFSKDGNIHLLGGGGEFITETDTDKIPYNLNEWYKVKVILDGKNKQYDLFLNDELIVTNRDAAGQQGDGITALRLAVCNNTEHGGDHLISDIDGKVYFDNIKISSSVDFPKAEMIFSPSGEIPTAGDSEIYLKFSESFSEENMTEKISLESEFGEMPVSSAEFNPNTLMLKVNTDGIFQSNVRYRLKMNKGTKVSGMVKTDADLYYTFDSSKNMVDVTKSDFYFEDGKLQFKADIENSTYDTEKMIMVIYVWDNDNLVFANAKEIQVNPYETVTESIFSKPYVKGETVEVFLFKLPELDQGVTAKQFKFSV